MSEMITNNEQSVFSGNAAPQPPKEDTPETNRMKENFNFFGLATFIYACFYAFCMYKNASGITFPFFMAGSLLFLCFTLAKLEITLRKGSAFYMISMMLLAVSTFCTDDSKIIALNKTAIFLLMMSLLLNQFYNTADWKLGKYLGSIFELVILCLGEMGRPFSDGMNYYHTRGKKNKTFWSGVLGAVIAVPLLLVVLGLLSAADALFRQITTDVIDFIQPENLFQIICRIGFMFFASYMLTSFLCQRTMKEEVTDKRRGEPVLAITITSLLSVVYLLFSGIQIFGLFLGKMQLPEGYTYAMYAREGFFQLLTVSVLNLIIVLGVMTYFKESKVLKIILTVMSLCTFVMIASSAMRMIIYIRYYYMTFLRIFVLWALVVLSLLFVGVIVSVYRERFPLFKYSMVVVTVLYVALSFSHPDYLIAQINVANAPHEMVEQNDITGITIIKGEHTENLEYGDEFFGGPFFLGDYYTDYAFLSELSADAAPVILDYMRELGYDLTVYEEACILDSPKIQENRRHRLAGFGYHYLENMQERLEGLNWRTFNISRYMAKLNLKK